MDSRYMNSFNQTSQLQGQFSSSSDNILIKSKAEEETTIKGRSLSRAMKQKQNNRDLAGRRQRLFLRGKKPDPSQKRSLKRQKQHAIDLIKFGNLKR